MRWWLRNGKQELSWKSVWRFWRRETRRRESGWRGLKAQFKGSRGLEDCSRQEAECEDRNQNMTCVRKVRRAGSGLVKKGVRRYVKSRITSVRFPGRRRKRHPYPYPSEDPDISHYGPTNFRHNPPPTPPTLPSLALEIPEIELWLSELWDDFLIEPTPYLVASATIYVGFVLLLSQYYAAIWQLSCFLFQFVPWDDDGWRDL